ncbi:PTS phosphocarrier protein NPr [Klebsiella pneumoniae]|nr:PTS phosphocarrier protein NPr [Klebsiella pneumoniae]
MTVKQTVEITNKLGMHARPAMKLFELMQNFDAEVLLRNDEGTEAEANSVITLLMLDSAKGATDRGGGPAVRRKLKALAAVIALFNAGFDPED